MSLYSGHGHHTHTLILSDTPWRTVQETLINCSRAAGISGFVTSLFTASYSIIETAITALNTEYRQWGAKYSGKPALRALLWRNFFLANTLNASSLHFRLSSEAR